MNGNDVEFLSRVREWHKSQPYGFQVKSDIERLIAMAERQAERADNAELENERLGASIERLREAGWTLVQSLYDDGEDGIVVGDQTAKYIDSLEAALATHDATAGKGNGENE